MLEICFTFEMLIKTSRNMSFPIGKSLSNVLHREFSALSHSLIDSSCKNKNQAKREKRRPPGTVEFIVSRPPPALLILQRHAACLNAGCPVTQVGPNDSLNSIALKFNITPNNLVQLNKLFTRSVYPGQV